jgi:hypothetical protein
MKRRNAWGLVLRLPVLVLTSGVRRGRWTSPSAHGVGKPPVQETAIHRATAVARLLREQGVGSSGC